MAKAVTTSGLTDREAYARDLFAVLVSNRQHGIQPEPSLACELAEAFFDYVEDRRKPVAKAAGGGDSKKPEKPEKPSTVLLREGKDPAKSTE